MAFNKRFFRAKRAFSLVEVVIALAVTAFALMALIGTLPTGIKTVKDSMNDSASANILQQIRAQMEQVSFGANASGSMNINTTGTVTNYYTPEGLLTNAAAGYYMATFNTINAYFPNTSTSVSANAFQATSAAVIQVIISYPLSAPTANQTQTTNYLFEAMQKNY